MFFFHFNSATNSFVLTFDRIAFVSRVTLNYSRANTLLRTFLYLRGDIKDEEEYFRLIAEFVFGGSQRKVHLKWPN